MVTDFGRYVRYPLPTDPGSVVRVDGDYLMLTKFGNWVSEGVFTLTPEEVDAEDWTQVHDNYYGDDE